jgi:hypothetical protein
MTNDVDDARLPRDTTPTWEVELLISGVAVFAMLQLPELLDRAILEWSPRFIDRWTRLLVLVYLYAKSAALILAATFVIHLLLRARWIALVGMVSIYPNGVDWSTMRLGPHARDIESRRLGRMETAIDRADNRATMVFALGVVMASILAAITLLVAALLAVAWWLETRWSFVVDPAWVAWSTLVVMVPYGLAMVVDRRFGARLAPGGWGERILRGILRAYTAMGMGMANNPAIALLSSRHGRQRTILLISFVFLVAVVAAMGTYFIAREPGAVGSYAAFPDGKALPARSIDTAHYDDRRDPLRDAVVPYLQSAVITGPYAQLVVPFVPDRDLPAMRTACPQLRPDTALPVDDASSSVSAADRLACLQRVRALTLDGHPLAVAYEIGRDPRTERPALVAMVDVRALAPGRHELRVVRPPRVRHKEHFALPAEPPQDILPFWR